LAVGARENRRGSLNWRGGLLDASKRVMLKKEVKVLKKGVKDTTTLSWGIDTKKTMGENSPMGAKKR